MRASDIKIHFDKQLGSGYISNVYLGENVHTKQKFAVKIVS